LIPVVLLSHFQPDDRKKTVRRWHLTGGLYGREGDNEKRCTKEGIRGHDIGKTAVATFDTPSYSHHRMVGAQEVKHQNARKNRSTHLARQKKKRNRVTKTLKGGGPKMTYRNRTEAF